MVDVIVTTAGGVEEDLIKVWRGPVCSLCVSSVVPEEAVLEPRVENRV
jgi:deoxyhypusine synthase